jgi:hypothetical protein
MVGKGNGKKRKTLFLLWRSQIDFDLKLFKIAGFLRQGAFWRVLS